MKYTVDYNQKSFLQEFLESNPDNALDMAYDAMADISLAISDYRYEKKWSQKQMAEKLGITQPMVSKIESGEYNFTIEGLCSICDKLGWEFSVNIQKDTIKCYINEPSYFHAGQIFQPIVSTSNEVSETNQISAA